MGSGWKGWKIVLINLISLWHLSWQVLNKQQTLVVAGLSLVSGPLNSVSVFHFRNHCEERFWKDLPLGIIDAWLGLIGTWHNLHFIVVHLIGVEESIFNNRPLTVLWKINTTNNIFGCTVLLYWRPNTLFVYELFN